jgi:hypothetical protein
MFGYPGVSWVSEDGKQIGGAAVREPSTLESTVNLSPGQFAMSVVFEPTLPNQKLAGCTREEHAVGIRIYPPADTVSTIVTQGGLNWEESLTWCSSRVVKAMVPPVAEAE